MFETPLLIEGFLEYLGPGVLRKVIKSPFQETFSIEAGEISMIRDGEVRRLPVRRSKALEAMLSAFESLLSGNAARTSSAWRTFLTARYPGNPGIGRSTCSQSHGGSGITWQTCV